MKKESEVWGRRCWLPSENYSEKIRQGSGRASITRLTKPAELSDIMRGTEHMWAPLWVLLLSLLGPPGHPTGTIGVTHSCPPYHHSAVTAAKVTFEKFKQNHSPCPALKALPRYISTLNAHHGALPLPLSPWFAEQAQPIRSSWLTLYI